MYIRHLIIGVSLVACALTYSAQVGAQNEGNYWYFGTKAGIKFGNGAPTALLDGQLTTSEGCATISDVDGNLLFYTDGIKVWNKNHAGMPNGFNLLGDPSSTQSGIIVPRPQMPGRYYIFTTPGVSSAPDNVGLRYSEVDMSLMGGLGDVIPETKNTLLFSPATEKLTGFKYNDMYWVLAHESFSNRFFAYKVTAAGIDPDPVISSTGLTYTWWQQGAGNMKVSPNGKYIACALYSSQTQNYHAELYTFDPNTGVVASHLQFPLQNQTYGVEFSPNSQRLFLGADPNLFQFDLTDPTPQTILNSQFTVHDAQTNGGGAVWGLQLGPDGKIYVAHVNTTKLGVVHTPNNYVGVGFVPLSTDLANRQCQYNLPTFLQSIFAEPEPCTNTNMRFFTVFRKSYVCTDCTNGKIAVNVIGGQAPITYSRDGINYQTSGIFDNLGPGSYTIYAKDANGCIISRTVVLQN